MKIIRKKKANETVKQELLNLLKQNDKTEEPGFEETSTPFRGNHNNTTLRGNYHSSGKKRIIGYVRKQGQLLKKFKEKEQIFRNVGQSKSTLYFKMGLYKHLQKSPHLKKKIKATCKNSVILFS